MCHHFGSYLKLFFIRTRSLGHNWITTKTKCSALLWCSLALLIKWLQTGKRTTKRWNHDMTLGMTFVELCFRVVTPLMDILKNILKFLRHGNTQTTIFNPLSIIKLMQDQQITAVLPTVASTSWDWREDTHYTASNLSRNKSSETVFQRLSPLLILHHTANLEKEIWHVVQKM